MLITGGAGFIGSNFIRMALANRPDWEIVNFDALTYAGNLQSLEDVAKGPRYQFIKGDISCPDDVEKAFSARIDVIVNFAAETHVDKSLYDVAAFLRTNVLGVGTLLEAARDHAVSKFVQISTDEVYGSIDGDRRALESDPLRPGSPYAASKAAADLLCLSFFNTHRVPVIITRSSNNYGPYQFPEKIIPFFITEAMKGKHLPVYGGGENIRDWIHVDDNCRAILSAIDKGAPGEIYNVGGENSLDNLSLTKMLLEIMELTATRIKFVEDRPGHDLRYALDSTRIRNLGWAPRVDLKDGLSKTVVWYSQNRKWWENVLSGEHLEFYERHYRKR